MPSQAKFEFRIPERLAKAWLPPDVGRTIGIGATSGGVRVVETGPAEPLFERIGELEREFRSRNDVFFVSWSVSRRNTTEALDQAEILRMEVRSAFEPCGEQCGTVYDESTACSICGAGRTMIGELVLDLRRQQPSRDIDLGTIRPGKDLARTIANEIVVSDRLATLIKAESLTGVELGGIRSYRRPSSSAPTWHHLRVVSEPIPVAPPTVFGVTPFDLDSSGEYRCPLGHVAGLNVLSELTLGATGPMADIQTTIEHIGRRVGYLVPETMLVISQRFHRLLLDHRVKGARVEVAHLQGEFT